LHTEIGRIIRPDRVLRHALSGALIASCLLVSASRAGAVDIPFLSADELKCQRAANVATTDYIDSVLTIRDDCFQDVLNGSLPLSVDCLADIDSGTGDTDLDDRLLNVRNKLLEAVTTRCLNVDLANLGYPGSCEDLDGAPFTAFDQEACIVKQADQTIDYLTRVEHPPVPAIPLTGAEQTCQDTIARKATRMFVLELGARSICQSKQLEGKISTVVDCRAEETADAPGTGDDTTDNDIVTAHNKVLRGIPTSCPHVDLTLLGFPNECPAPQGSTYPLSALTECMFDTHHSRLIHLVDTVDPVTSKCGNGVLDFTEQCDDGDTDYHMGDICRGDCTVIYACGDPNDSGSMSIVDAQFTLRAAVGLDSCALELCDVDDNGHVSVTDSLRMLQHLIGLNVAMTCPLPTSLTCGNSVTDPGEVCDDGNTLWSFGDLCNASCQRVQCGDPNDSGTISVLDASYALRTAIGLAECAPQVCDINDNGAINTTDVLMILQKAIGLPVEFNCPF
jgi:cysteine-rich repeat protein